MDWKIIEGRLTRNYKLKGFSEIITKLTSLAKVADEQKHHPDFEVKDYNTICFSLWTHDENGITQKDYDLAKEIDLLFEG